ncbi:hypothetical protein BIW11_14207, partial [Tropilaelaps mercedesae]
VKQTHLKSLPQCSKSEQRSGSVIAAECQYERGHYGVSDFGSDMTLGLGHPHRTISSSRLHIRSLRFAGANLDWFTLPEFVAALQTQPWRCPMDMLNGIPHKPTTRQNLSQSDHEKTSRGSFGLAPRREPVRRLASAGKMESSQILGHLVRAKYCHCYQLVADHRILLSASTMMATGSDSVTDNDVV